MITEGIISVLAALFVAVGDLMPDFDTPSFVPELAGLVGSVTSQMAPLGVWLPFGPAGTALQVVVAAVGVSLLVRLVRIVAAFLTGGGGGAA